ncbi:MAG: hypothetical protein II695_01625, partial [Oscillospiraceae bacterium]|nr:hypothetical protein [Oscillospiraceae bacterium]
VYMLADKIAGVIVTGFLFVFFTFINWRIVYIGRVKKEKAASPAPLLGGLSGAILMLALFGKEHPFLIFLPFLLDYGCIPLFVEFLVVVVRDIKNSPK